ncbi:MAG TPA: hypothetical protein P5072_08620, partial [Parvularculaceae bacterium]|nr:hypothetical protein [Parvularculaceae bacterium]
MNLQANSHLKAWRESPRRLRSPPFAFLDPAPIARRLAFLPEEEIVRVERGELGAQEVDLVAAAKVD